MTDEMTYESYRDVASPWLSTVPTHWNFEKIGMHFAERKVKVSDKDYSPLSVSKKGVVPQLATAVKTNNGDNRKLVKKGDFVINSRSDRKGSSGLSVLDGSVSLINIVLKPYDMHPRYSHYLFRSQSFIEEFYRNGRGLVSDLWTTRFSEMRNILIPIPPQDEQIQIVKYLDMKTEKINRFIKDKKNQIALINEQKHALINHAVTKGIEPHSKYATSGTMWIGEVPAHWEIKKMKSLFSIKKNIAGTEGFDVLSVTQSGLKVKDVASNEGQIAQDYSKYQLVALNDYVMNHMDLLTGYVDCAKIEGVTSPDYRVFVMRDDENNDRDYFLFMFQLCYKRRIFFGYGQGVATSGRWRLPATNFMNMDIPVPPLEEQQRISKYIREISMKIDKYVKAIELEIDLVMEYRTRLISDVVTGRLDVRSINIEEFVAQPLDFDDNEDIEADNDIEEMEGANGDDE